MEKEDRRGVELNAGAETTAETATETTTEGRHDEGMDRRTFVRGAAAAVGVSLLVGSLAACDNAGSGTGGTGSPEGPASGTGKEAADGIYTTSAQGRNGQVVTVTTISGGAITKVEVSEQQETEVFASEAMPQMCADIVAANSYGVDTVAGATWACLAIKNGVAEAIAQGGGDASRYDVPTQYENVQDETIDVDIAIVGAGFSGIISACRAAQTGAKVALIDKSIVGGCSLQSFAIAVYDGAEVVEAKLNDWLAGQMYLADPALIHRYLSNSMDLIAWIRQFNDTVDFFPYGLEFFGMPMGMLCDYMARPKVYAEMFDKTVLKNGGTVRTSTTAKSLLTDSSGAVTGVVAERRDGSTLTINAKAVSIATGGFGGNTALLQELTGQNVVCGCITQCVGEGEEMVYAVGAQKPINMGGMMLHQTLATSTSKMSGYPYFQQQMPMVMGYVPSVLNVDDAGNRFRNEDWVNTPTAAAAGGAFAGGVTYVLLDAGMVKALETGGTAAIGFTESPGMPPEYKPDFEPTTPWADFSSVLGETVQGDWGFTGATLDELASAAGMDAGVLKATVDTYNTYCKAGRDEFFNKSAQHLVAYGDGPYYLIGITYNQLGTIGGIVVNDKFQVLDDSKKAIAGLYSTGAEAYGTCWNRNYYGEGDGVGFAMVSGYVAGQILADYVAGK